MGLSVMKALLIVHVIAAFAAYAAAAQSGIVAETANGLVEGITLESGIHVFKGIPYAAPPVRELRWRAPQPVSDWDGVRRADRFADQCMQQRVFEDMRFRNSGVSEDCLYLNVWTPEVSSDAGRPVLVYFYGGGFIAGDGSEPRYDGESMAREGIVVVTMSYRLGVFGFFAHPALTEESPHHASGNYALLDQYESLRWVSRNIAAFGGHPDRVTIAGESAGSFSVSAQMASPLSKGLIAGAIGESGSLLGSRAPATLDEIEDQGEAFAARLGASSLRDLRRVSAMELLHAASQPGTPRFSTAVDGYFFPESPVEIFAEGKQAHVPLMVGWNSAESHYRGILGANDPTPENFVAAVRNLYGERTDEILAVYSASTEEEARQAATDLAGDRFIGFSTWKWAELHRQTGEAPVFQYFYAHPRPPMRPEEGGPAAEETPEPPLGAAHSAEIEYALGNLDVNDVYVWEPEDYDVSEVLQGYFVNFIRSGDPNGPSLPEWPQAGSGGESSTVRMRISVDSRAETSPHRERYLLLDRLAPRPSEGR